MSGFEKKYTHIYDSILHDLNEFANIDLGSFLGAEDHVLEYGCGTGEASLRFAVEFPSINIFGVDLHDAFKSITKPAKSILNIDVDTIQNLKYSAIGTCSSNVAIASDASTIKDKSYATLGRYKFIFSWCVFEHINQELISQILGELYTSLADDGLFYFRVNPLFYSERGSHLNQLNTTQWCHLIYQHDVLKSKFIEAAISSGVSPNNIDLIWHQYETLNRFTADMFKQELISAGFKILKEDRKYSGRPSSRLKSAYTEEALRNKDILFILSK
ncbi:class I SAM-dependent methyltransferase [Methylomonas sp. MgM2]